MNELVEKPIDDNVRNYRALIVFSNRRCGSASVVKWFLTEHNKYILWDQMKENVTKLGYKVQDSNLTEIFNKGGCFEDVITQYKKDGDIQRLQETLDVIMAYRPTFRIIIEELNWDVVERIVHFINPYHMSALMVHRKKSFDRMLSWMYHFNNKKIDVKKAVAITHEVNDVNSRLWELFKRAGCRFGAAPFEDLYGRMSDSTILHIIFRWLFYRIWDFTAMKETGAENLDKYYHEMKGVDRLEKALAEIKRPTFSNIHIDV
jgi:hypothetical protein